MICLDNTKAQIIKEKTETEIGNSAKNRKDKKKDIIEKRLVSRIYKKFQ